MSSLYFLQQFLQSIFSTSTILSYLYWAQTIFGSGVRWDRNTQAEFLELGSLYLKGRIFEKNIFKMIAKQDIYATILREPH